MIAEMLMGVTVGLTGIYLYKRNQYMNNKYKDDVPNGPVKVTLSKEAQDYRDSNNPDNNTHNKNNTPNLQEKKEREDGEVRVIWQREQDPYRRQNPR